jgi:GT2 family glycosyltransferase
MIAIVVTTWQRRAKLLRNSLETLSRQTAPPLEIVILDQNPKGDKHVIDNHALADEYELARHVHAPRAEFNLSWGFNVGIQNTSEEADFVMTTGMEMIFGPNVMEEVQKRASPTTAIFSPCGFLPKQVDASNLDDVLARWDWYKSQVVPNPPRPCSTGTLICVTREWWFKARGYDETRPFNYTDADVNRRTRMGGLVQKNLQWPECQILHPWHEPSPYVHSLGGIWPLPTETGWIRNPGGWGQLP